MSKKTTSVLVFFFLLTIFALSYFCYIIYCKTTISSLQSQVVTAQRTWDNYFRTVNKINNAELNYLVNSPNLINALKELDKSIAQNSSLKINEQLSNLEDYSFSKLSKDIDLVVIYSSDGIIRAGFEKDSDTIPFVNLPQTISNVLDGNQVALNINLTGNLYYCNLAPISSNGNKLGVVLLGKKINNATAAYIQELSNTNLVVFSKDKLLASSLPFMTADNLFEKFRQIDPQLMNLIKKSNPTQANTVELLKLDSGEFWAAGQFLTDRTGGYLLLVPNSKWVSLYLFINQKMIYILPSVLLLCGILAYLTSCFITSLTTKINTTATETKEKINNTSKVINFKLDKEIDMVLDRILCFFNIEFFKSSKELNDLSNTIFSMVKEYKAKMIVENFSNNNTLGNIVNPITKNDCDVRTKKSTLLYSNVKEFNQLIEYFSAARAFTLLSIYLKIQQEVITKHNGRIIKQNDDRIVAAFESASHATDAIKAAFEIQNTINKLSSVNPENIELSIAIASGEVITAYMFDQVSYVGRTAKVADSLCSYTEPGWISIDKFTYDIAGVERLNANQDMVVIKGVKQPVQYYKFDPDSIVAAIPLLTIENVKELEETEIIS
ncbi:MAG: adenylate/guanylate cyclase domain-containing protein [Cyanobacteriota bacterium]